MISDYIKQSVEFVKTLDYNKRKLNKILKQSGRDLLYSLLGYENILIENDSNKDIENISNDTEIMCDYYSLVHNDCRLDGKLHCKKCDRKYITEY